VATYRILAWKDIPSAVEASDGDETARVLLSQRFQDLIDAIAMRESETESDAYLEGWAEGEAREAPGNPRQVAARVAAEQEERFEEILMRRFHRVGASPIIRPPG